MAILFSRVLKFIKSRKTALKILADEIFALFLKRLMKKKIVVKVQAQFKWITFTV